MEKSHPMLVRMSVSQICTYCKILIPAGIRMLLSLIVVEVAAVLKAEMRQMPVCYLDDVRVSQILLSVMRGRVEVPGSKPSDKVEW